MMGKSNCSSDSSVEQRLRQQVQQIQQYPPLSPERQLLLNQLMNDICKSDQLAHPQKSSWPANLYADLYNEALQRTLLNICQKIDSYNPEHPVMAWVNFRLNCEFINVINDYRKQGVTQIPKTGAAIPIVSLPTLDDLNLTAVSHVSEEENSTIQLLQQFLRTDPEGLLQQRHLRERPDITFQTLAIAKFIEEKSWAELAIDLEIPAATLCSFFNRQLKNLAPYFKKHLKE
jgi:hypothetical protein